MFKCAIASPRFAFDLRGEFLQINLLAGGREFVRQQIPILCEAYGAAGRDRLARAENCQCRSKSAQSGGAIRRIGSC